MFLTQKRLFMAFCLLLLAIGFRGILPSLIVLISNHELEHNSKNFAFHIDDLDLRIIRGEYVIRGITGKLKPSGKIFLKVNDLTAKIPWKSIFRGRIMTDLEIDKMNVIVSQELRAKAKVDNRKHLGIRTILVRNSNIVIQETKSQISDVYLQATNLSQDRDNLQLYFHLSGCLFGPAPFRVIGLASIRNKISQLDINAEIKNFDLTTLNPFLKHANIQSGKMDLYAEARSLEGNITGYVKPFVQNLKFENADTVTQSPVLKQLLSHAQAKIPFEYVGKVIIHDRYIQTEIRPGIEDIIGQRGLGRMMMQVWRQAQEEE